MVKRISKARDAFRGELTPGTGVGGRSSRARRRADEISWRRRSIRPHRPGFRLLY
jgi:hypothetical protein